MKQLLKLLKTKPKPQPKLILTKKDLIELSKKNIIFRVVDMDTFFETQSITLN